MKRVKWTLRGDYGDVYTGEVEVEDDATEEDIEGACIEEVWNYLDLYWTVEKSN